MSKRKKKGNKAQVVVLSIGIVALLLGVFIPAGFYGLHLNKVTFDQGADFVVDSDYVVKVGLKGELVHCSFFGACDPIGFVNSLIDNVYGYAIGDTPILVDEEMSDDLVEFMNELNTEITDQINVKYFGYQPIFSDKLISVVSKGSYEFSDLKVVMDELEVSADVFCGGVVSYIEDHPGADREDGVSQIASVCSTKPDRIFVREGSKYVTNFNDIPIYDTVYVQQCFSSVDEMNDAVGDNQGGICAISEISSDGYSYDADAADGNLVQTSPREFCCQIPSEEKELLGTIMLSDLSIEVYEKASDIFIGVNDKGIGELDQVDGKFDFAQYGFEVEHKGSLSENDFGEKPGYFVVSSSQGVVDASEGEIEESTGLGDLWYGIRGGRVFKSPSYTVMIVATLISWSVFFVMLIVLGTMFVLRRE